MNLRFCWRPWTSAPRKVGASSHVALVSQLNPAGALSGDVTAQCRVQLSVPQLTYDDFVNLLTDVCSHVPLSSPCCC